MSEHRQSELMEVMSGQKGGRIVSSTSEQTGNFCCIFALSDCVINTTTGNITGISGTTLKAGLLILGSFTSVTLTSGECILYNE